MGHNVLGDKETVRGFKSEDCKRFTQRLYRPDNAVFYVYGDIDFKQLTKKLNLLSGEKKEGEIIRCDKTFEGLKNELHGKRENDEEQQTHQAHVMIGTAFGKDLEKWRIPLYLTNNILGGPSMNSRLNLELREKRGLVYTVESIMTSYTDSILWTVYFGCDPHDVNRCIRLVKSQLAKLRNTPLSSTALANAKRQIKGQIALASENRENYAISMAKQYLHRGTLKSNERLYKRIDDVKVEDIHQLANEILNEDRLFTLVFS
jgi:predicted Zn-dependent peptidase